MAGERSEEPAGSPGWPAPPPAAAQRQRPPPRGWRALVPGARLALIVGLVVLAVAVAAGIVLVTGPPSEEDLLQQAGLVGKRELLVGVKADQPGVDWRNPQTGVFSGFDIDIAYMVASDLGFRPSEVRFLAIQSEDRERMRAHDPRSRATATVDLVVASYSITPAREAAGARFSAPYLRTEQSVLTRRGHRTIQSLADLRAERVCTISTSTSADALRRAGIASPQQENDISGCVAGLFDDRHYDAVTTDAAILAGFAHDPRYRDRLVHQDIGLETEEAWGINVGPNEALRTLVNLSLYRSWTDPADRRWEDAYDRNFRPEQPDSPDQDVAIDLQPPVPKPAVREWPWQRRAGGA